MNNQLSHHSESDHPRNAKSLDEFKRRVRRRIESLRRLPEQRRFAIAKTWARQVGFSEISLSEAISWINQQLK